MALGVFNSVVETPPNCVPQIRGIPLPPLGGQVFTLTVIANFIALAHVGGMPPPRVTPLALLFLTGLYLFKLPYFAKRRRRRQT